MTPRRIGLLGGTFDPVHAGHLAVAAACRLRASLDEVRFVVNRTPPHKPPAEADAIHRLAMVELAVASEPAFVADGCELEREGPSWTIDTLERLVAEDRDSELHLLVGGDSLRDFPTWRRAPDILRLARLVATGREGLDLDAAARASGVPPERLLLVRDPMPPWRSRDLRLALRSGRPPEGSIPGAVVEYIRRNRLYAEAPDHGGDHPRTHA